MGKKGKGKGKGQKEPDKPFTFDINNFKVERTRPGMMRLLPVIPPGFEQVAFKLRISKDFRTGKPKYDIVYYECSMLGSSSDKNGTDSGKDLRVFSLLVPDTGRTLIVDPKRSNGQPPFFALDPVTNTEAPIAPPYIIHYDPASGRNFLLDLRKFEGGKLAFKDERTNETLVADLTKRVDPLTHKPLHPASDDAAGVTFVGQIQNGEHYVMKSEGTGSIQILDTSGNPVDVTAKGFTTTYDKETDTTTLIDEKEQPLLTIDGKVSLERMAENEESDNDKDDEAEVKFRMIQDPTTGNMTIVDDKGDPVEPQPNHYFVFENPKTGKLELVDASGQPVDAPEFKLAKDPDTDKTILVDSTGKPLTDTIKELADMVLVNEEDLSQQMAFEAKKAAGKISSSQAVKRGYGKYQKRSPTSARGAGKYSTSPSEDTGESEETSDLSRDSSEETQVTTKEAKRGDLMTMLQPPSSPEKTEVVNEKLAELEKYFADLEYEEARNIVTQVMAAPQSSRPVFLRVLREVIELNRELIRCVLTEKRKAEIKYARILLQEKQARQNQYIADLMRIHSGDYDLNKVQARALRKLERENELLLDKLDVRITAENKIAMGLVKENIMKDSKKIIRYTNIPCYRNFKRIVYKELMKSLDLEIQQVKAEVCKILKTEKDSTLLEINNAAVNEQQNN